MRSCPKNYPLNTILTAALLAVWLASALLLLSAVADPSAADPPSGPSLAAAPPELDVVLFAGGAGELLVPNGWRVSEIPHGREMRLWLLPGDVQREKQPQDGIWLTFHWRGRSATPEALERLLDDRTGAKPPVGGASMATRIGDFHALARQMDGRKASIWVLAASTETGILEFGVVASPEVIALRRATADAVMSKMKFAAPRLRVPKVIPQVSDARATVGLWKSLKGRMRLGADGRVTVRFDSKRNFALDEAGLIDYERRVTRLTGSYNARQDMIFVVWDDGSRLNYRWQISEGQLLLTDHNGRVSQLNRLIE